MSGISVIIPTFNRRREVLRAIASVKAQSFPADEILVIDDGSTDDTPDHVCALSAPVRYVRTANHGVSAARNRGIREARGEWIAFLDSDDEWSRDKLARQMEAGRDADLVFTACETESGERLDDLDAMDPDLPAGGTKRYPPAYQAFFRHPRHPFIQSALIRRDLLIRIGGFDESLRVAEDTKLIYRLVLETAFAVINDPLVRISRDREGAGLSDDGDPAVAMTRYACYARVQNEFRWQLLHRAPAAARVLRANQGYFVSRWAELACVNGERALGRALGREGFALAPDWKSRLRCLAAAFAPGVLERRRRPSPRPATGRPEPAP